jgi:transcriptional regulator with XRE-family HTH domain
VSQKNLILQVFGDSVRAKRLELGFSQEELGYACNLDRTYISGVERGKRNPSLLAIFNIARGLQQSVAELTSALETV